MASCCLLLLEVVAVVVDLAAVVRLVPCGGLVIARNGVVLT